MDETIAHIKADLRAAMNGVAAQYMRERGLTYHVIFGIELPRLRDIAADYTPSARLAAQLWDENVRESKILATLLMPTDGMDRALADLWIDRTPNEEIAGLLAMNLLARLPFAPDLAFCSLAAPQRLRRITGFYLLANLLRQGAQLSPRAEDEARDQAACALAETDDAALMRAARAVMNRLQP